VGIYITIISLNATCSRHAIAEKLLIWRYTTITHSLKHTNILSKHSTDHACCKARSLFLPQRETHRSENAIVKRQQTLLSFWLCSIVIFITKLLPNKTFQFLIALRISKIQ